MTKQLQDSAFYTNESGTEVVWISDKNPFYVVRAGEMRINAIDDKGTGWIIRYTDQLERFGVKTDEQLLEWTEKGEKMSQLGAEGIFDWLNNSWFEVYSESDPDFFSEPLHELDEAIKQAEVFLVEYPDGIYKY
jgi:hypothetical protein